MFQKLLVFTGFSLVAFSSGELKPSRSLWCYFWHNRDTDTTCISILCDIPENILLKGWSANLIFFSVDTKTLVLLTFWYPGNRFQKYFYGGRGSKNKWIHPLSDNLSCNSHLWLVHTWYSAALASCDVPVSTFVYALSTLASMESEKFKLNLHVCNNS